MICLWRNTPVHSDPSTHFPTGNTVHSELETFNSSYMLMEYSQKSLFIGDRGNLCNCNDENVETKWPLKWKKEIVLPKMEFVWKENQTLNLEQTEMNTVSLMANKICLYTPIAKNEWVRSSLFSIWHFHEVSQTQARL